MVSAYSIPKARRQSLATTERMNPGPGQYSPENTNRSHNVSFTQTPLSFYKTNPAFSIGKEKRKTFNFSPGPGTGKYNVEQKFKKSPDYTFGLKTPHNLNNSAITPSPNAYKIDDSLVMRRNPKYSIGISRDQSPTDMFKTINSMTPGPGQYDNKSALKTHTAMSFCKDKRTKSISYTPGPGTYDSNKFTQFLENPPHFSFGNEKRTKTYESYTPAPGTYEVDQSTMDKSGGFISKHGRCSTENGYIPGPGQYNQDISPLKKKSENAIFGKSLRSSPTRNTSPGPNEYNMPQIDTYKNKLQNTIFGKSLRPRGYSIGTPGPGAYKNIMMWNTGIEFSMPGRSKDFIFGGTPGPADYDASIKPIKIQSPNITIGKSNRDSPDCKFYNTSYAPGPGNYNTTYTPGVKNMPQHSFPKARRGSKQSRNITPGPADYKIPPTFADVPKYLLNN